jgi:hypothetical protein
LSSDLHNLCLLTVCEVQKISVVTVKFVIEDADQRKIGFDQMEVVDTIGQFV